MYEISKIFVIREGQKGVKNKSRFLYNLILPKNGMTKDEEILKAKFHATVSYINIQIIIC